MRTYKEFSNFWIIFSVGYLMDIVTTTYGLRIGFYEANRSLNTFIGIPLSFLVILIFYLVANKAIEEKKIDNILPYIFIFGFISWLAPIHNIILILTHLF